MFKYIKFFSWSTLCFITLSNPAYAYLDPGTGSVILQAIVAGIAAFVTGIVFYWNKLKIFLKNKFKSENIDQTKKK